MTVLFLSHENDKVMGSTLSLADMIDSLMGAGVKCIVVLPGDGPAKDLFESKGIRCITARYHVDFVPLGHCAKRVLTFLLRLVRDIVHTKLAIRKICGTLADEKIDIVHTNTSVIDFGQDLARKLGAKHVWHLREMLRPYGFNAFRGNSRLRCLIANSDATISITKAVADYYRVPLSEKNQVIFDAVRSRSSLLPAMTKENRFVFCGLLSEIKHPDDAIKAFVSFSEDYPDYCLDVLGQANEPEYLDYLKNLVPGHIAGRVIFHGYVSNPDEYMARAKALLMCSHNEALGRVSIEAMFNLCPVVAYAGGGSLELIRDNITGFFYTSQEGITEKIEMIVSDVEKAEVVAADARNFALQNFLIEDYSEKIRGVYSRL